MFLTDNLTQHVSFPTHRDQHTLDLVITPTSSSLAPIIDYSPVSPSDHFPIFSSLTLSPLSPPPLTQFSFRCFKSISILKFSADILHSRLITHQPTNLCNLSETYNTILFPLSSTSMLLSKLNLFVQSQSTNGLHPRCPLSN